MLAYASVQAVGNPALIQLLQLLVENKKYIFTSYYDI